MVDRMGREHRLELRIHLDRGHATRGLHKCQRERADTGAHLKHTLGARELGEVHNALDHMVVDEEVLPQAVLCGQAKGLEHLSRGGGIGQRGGCHGRNPSR